LQDADCLHRYPVVALAGAWLLVLVGDLDGALGLAATAEDHLGSELLDGVTPAAAGVALFHAVLCGEGVERMTDDVQVALKLTPDDSPNRAMALQLLGVANLLVAMPKRRTPHSRMPPRRGSNSVPLSPWP
jgi:hypothetical protein